MNIRSIAVTLQAVLFALATFAAQANIVVGNYQQVEETRIGFTTYQYSYTADATNTGLTDQNDVSAILELVSSNATVISNELTFGDVAAGATVTSTNTVTVEFDRRRPFNGTINWAARSPLMCPATWICSATKRRCWAR